MTLLAPLGLALGLALGVLVVFYLLKVQPLDREVASTYLWERLLPDLAAHQPWQRPRFPPLFFIQALLLLALALGLARPATLALGDEGVAEVLVLDATASMGATDGAPTRFAQARAMVRDAIGALPEGSTTTLVLAGAAPTVLVAESGDRSALLAALDQAQPTDAASDLGDALRLAASVARNRPRGRVDVYTDGAFDLPADLREPTVPLAWHVVGGGAANRGITALSARADPQNQRRQQVYLRVQGFAGDRAGAAGAVGQEVLVTLAVDGQPVETRSLTLGASGSADAVFDDLPASVGVVEARLSGADALAADDRAALVLERARPTRALLVSRGNLFLEKALGLLPNVQVDRIQPRSFGGVAAEDYDLLVIDNDVPDIVPSRPLLIVNPASSPFLTVDGQLTRPGITARDHGHPLLRNVDLADVRLARAPRLEAPGWAMPVVESAGGPLLLAGEVGGRRVVVLAVDLNQSNLALTPAFPILMANAVGYLEPPGFLSASVLAPGAAVTLSPPADVRSIVVQSPGGRQATLPASGRPISFADTAAVGIYRVSESDGARTVAEAAFAVDLLDAAESDLRARALPAGPAEAPGAQRPVARELWQWLLGLGLVTLVGEWWWYHRK